MRFWKGLWRSINNAPRKSRAARSAISDPLISTRPCPPLNPLSACRPPSSDLTPEPLPWPDTLADQTALVRGVTHQTAWQPGDGAKALARHFTGVRAPTVQRLVDALSALGHVGQVQSATAFAVSPPCRPTGGADPIKSEAQAGRADLDF